MILDVEKINQNIFVDYPFQWTYYKDIFNQEFIKQLTHSFPSDNFQLRQAKRIDKSYKMQQCTLYDSRENGIILQNSLSILWLELINELTSKYYIRELSKLAKLDLKSYDIEINCWKYGNGDWLSPHTDKPEKIMSQLFYFNETWDVAWGGSFRILKSDNIENFDTEIFPSCGNSIIFLRCDNSWHGVTKQITPSNISRNVLQLVFWK